MPNHSRAWRGRLALGLILIMGFLIPGLGLTSRAKAQSPSPSPSIGEGPRVEAPRGVSEGPPRVRVDDEGTALAELSRLRIAINAIWIMIAAFLVMSLKAGFALVETGLIRAKNVAHTMSMNFAIYAVVMIGFWALGFAFMFGGHGPFPAVGGSNALDSMGSITLFGHRWDLIGFSGFFLSGPASEAALLSIFVFQAMFLDTAATIPTGAMAERWKFKAFLAYGVVASTVIYPVYGCWVWGNGWLSDLGVMFGMGSGVVDLAGSSVVHMTGGVMALAGAMALGPRIGKFNKNGSVNAIPGHNVPMVVVGTLILAFGWFGLNAGRALDATDLRIGSIATCTLLATGAGCLTSMGTMWATYGKPDPTMSCNGLLAGAVAISASCGYVNSIGAVAIGAIAGALVVGSILFLEKGMGIDDPVGAISVHGVCGAFGTLSVGFFATGEYGAGLNGVIDAPIGLLHGGGFSQLLAQMIGVAANLLWTLPASLLAFAVIGRTIGNRVSAKAEVEGLDVPEMGVLGYVPEETYAVQTASQDYLATFGPGVPPKGSSSQVKGSGKVDRKRRA
jgi:ammonium transporter, Amt family